MTAPSVTRYTRRAAPAEEWDCSGCFARIPAAERSCFCCGAKRPDYRGDGPREPDQAHTVRPARYGAPPVGVPDEHPLMRPVDD